MKLLACFSLPALMTVLVAGTLMMTGCEVTSESDRVSVKPENAVIHKGETLTLRADGGDDFSWFLSDHTLGTLSSTRGESVVYTSIFAPPVNAPVVQTITVVADLGESGVTNSAISEKIARSFVTHVTGAVNTNTSINTNIPVPTVTVTPPGATLRYGQTVTLRASGDTTYTWSLKTPEWGILSMSSGGDIQYTSQYAGPDGKSVVQEVKALGSRGGIGLAYVTQRSSILRLEPSAVQLRKNELQQFNVYGGDGHYAWSLSDTKLGVLSRTDGDYTVYTSVHSNGTATVVLQTLTVTDLSGATASGIIYHMPQT